MKLSNKIELHPLTGLLFLIGFLTGYFKYIFFIFLIVLIHESGHVFFASIFKRKVASISLLPFGGLTKIEGKISEDIFEDLLIAIGGIFFQTILGFVLFFLHNKGYISSHTFEFLQTYNVIMIGFNLMPVCPLDGYKIVKLFGELIVPYKVAAAVAFAISVSSLMCASVLNFELLRDNVFVFVFLLFMIVEEVKMQKYATLKFYVERMNYDFYYSKINVRSIQNMFKNRINYIDGRHEKEVLKIHFTGKGD